MKMVSKLNNQCRINKKSEVADFYSGKSVFITGGTGFLGKVLIEKLLYSCKDIDKVYILVREKKGVSAYDRIVKITDSPVFERVKNERPEDLKKLVPLMGNICENDLGLIAADLKGVEEEVSVVFHVAASIGFVVHLKDAMSINVIGTENVIKLCHRFKKLQAFIHVSTAYSNTDRDKIDEIVYPAPHSMEYALEMAEKYSENKEVVDKVLGKRPNTYTYTKSLAEDIVVSKRYGIPAAIIRPSVVISCLKEPCPGWLDNWNGPTGLIEGIAKGVTRVLLGEGDYVFDLVPVDIVTNLIIVAATRCKRAEELKVYNCCSGSSNSITFNELIACVANVSAQYGLSPFPLAFFIRNRFLYTLMAFIFHTIPAYIMHFWSYLMGKKSRHLRVQEKLKKVAAMFEFFRLNQWQFSDANVRNLLDTMSAHDKETFNFDVKSYTWNTYLRDYVLGIQKFLLKAPYKA